MIGRTQGHLAAAACVLILGACSDPEEHTDLRPSGAPEVLTVLVSTDAAGVVEGATFCKPNDDKRPGRVPAILTADPGASPQVCSDVLSEQASEVEDAVPLSWYVRIQFDELLNPDVEELLPIPNSEQVKGSLMKSQPVVLSCGGVNVDYDGYYDPEGNAVTWPLGPSLFIAPLDPTTIPTGTACTVALKADVVADKDGTHVPAGQLGPYDFKIATLALIGENPSPPRDPAKPDLVAPEDPLILTFNAQINVESLTPDEVVIREVTHCDTNKNDGTDDPGIVRLAKIDVVRPDPDDPDTVDPTSIAVSDAGALVDVAFEPNKIYVIEFADGADVTQDIANGGTGVLPAPAKVSICFQTDDLAP